MKLSDALTAIAPALQTTPRFLQVPLVLQERAARAFNGQIMARAPLDSDYGPLAVDSDKFTKIWTEGSTLTVGEVFAVVKRNKTQFRVGKMDLDLVVHTEFIPAEIPFTKEQQDAVRLAAKFASTNAIHPWACGVSITPDGVVATNNQVLVFVPCDFNYALTLPFWAVSALPAASTEVCMGWNDHVITFASSNGVLLQASRLSADMPEVVGQLASKAEPARDRLPDVAQTLEELQHISGRHFVLNEGSLAVEGSNGEEAVAEVDIKGHFRMTIETARLVLSHATHIDFDLAPDKLRFSKESYPQMFGFAAGMR